MQKYKHILKDRKDAAQKLRDVIPMQKFKEESWKVIAISRGGVEISSYLCERTKNEIDFLFSEAIYAPNNPECEIACVSEKEEMVINESLVMAFDIKYDYIYGEAQRKQEEKNLSSIYKFRKGKPFASMTDKVVLLVDEGSETGLRLLTAIKTILVMRPKALYIAVPVLPSDVLETLEPFADELFFLYDIEDYVETTLYYEELNNVQDETIEKILGNKVI